MTGAMPSRRNRTDPSPSRNFAPPGCILPKLASENVPVRWFSLNPGLVTPWVNVTVSISRVTFPPSTHPLHPPLLFPAAQIENRPLPMLLGLTFWLTVDSPIATVLLSPSVTSAIRPHQVKLL